MLVFQNQNIRASNLQGIETRNSKKAFRSKIEEEITWYFFLWSVLPEIFSENVLFGENFLKFHGILIFIAFLLLNILTSTYLKSTLGTSSGNPAFSSTA